MCVFTNLYTLSGTFCSVKGSCIYLIWIVFVFWLMCFWYGCLSHLNFYLVYSRISLWVSTLEFLIVILMTKSSNTVTTWQPWEQRRTEFIRLQLSWPVFLKVVAHEYVSDHIAMHRWQILCVFLQSIADPTHMLINSDQSPIRVW